MTKYKYILSVDGGGVRGIIPAIILAEIEKRAKKPITQMFDMMAGTSAGGIVVALLCMKDGHSKPQYSANDVVNLFQEQGSYLYKSSRWRLVGHYLSGAKYSHTNLENLLDKYFKDTTLNDVSNKLLLTSHDMYNDSPFFFKSWSEDSSVIKLKDAVRATTAAPTYFDPKYLKIKGDEKVLIDGGISANNPAACAFASAKRMYPNETIKLLSIGTGRTTQRVTHANAKLFGKLNWLNPLIHAVFNSGLAVVNYQLGEIISDRYIRLQSQLEIASAEMDNITPKNVKNLMKEANTVIEHNQEIINKVSKWQVK